MVGDEVGPDLDRILVFCMDPNVKMVTVDGMHNKIMSGDDWSSNVELLSEADLCVVGFGAPDALDLIHRQSVPPSVTNGQGR